MRYRALCTWMAAGAVLCGCVHDEGEGLGDARPDAGTASPGSVLVTLTNASAGPIWIQTGTEEGPPSWYGFRDGAGNGVGVHGSCAVCICGQVGCGVCGISMPSVARLEPGDSLEARWDGQIWLGGVDDAGRECQRTGYATSGPFTVHLCWSAAAPPEDWPMLGATTCADEAFVLGRDATVEHRVE